MNRLSLLVNGTLTGEDSNGKVLSESEAILKVVITILENIKEDNIELAESYLYMIPYSHNHLKNLIKSTLNLYSESSESSESDSMPDLTDSSSDSEDLDR